MKLLHLISIVAFSFIAPACGKEPSPGPVLLDELQAQYDRKLAELRQLSKDHIAGWPSDMDCDAALWAGVARAAGMKRRQVRFSSPNWNRCTPINSSYYAMKQLAI